MHPVPNLPRSIRNPVTGDAIRFLASPLMGDGDALVFRCILPGSALGAPLHRHSEMTEIFIVESGALELDLGGGTVRRLEPGDSIHLPPGTEHGFRNALETETMFLNVSTPGIDLETFLRALYALAANGDVKTDGMPSSPLVLAAALGSTDMTMAGMPPRLQRGIIAILARIAAWTGTALRVRHGWMSGAAGTVR